MAVWGEGIALKAKSLGNGQGSGASCMMLMGVKNGSLKPGRLSTFLSEFYSVRTIFTTNDQEHEGNESKPKFALLESSVDCDAFVIETEG